jgi:MFS family permease
VGWRAIFWVNVPVGLILVVLGRLRLAESRGPRTGLDLAGVVLGSAGLFGVVWAVIRVGEAGWASAGVSLPLAGGVVLLVAFVRWEMRTPAPMLPMRFFRHRVFVAGGLASLAMYSAVRRPVPDHPAAAGRAGREPAAGGPAGAADGRHALPAHTGRRVSD